MQKLKNFKNKKSYSTIFGVSLIALFMIITAISAVVLFATPVEAVYNPGGCPRETLFEDDFETGSIDTGKWSTYGDPEITDQSPYVYAGTYSCLLDGGADPDDLMLSAAIDTTYYKDVYVSYYRMTKSLESDNWFWAEYSTNDGADWTIMEQLTGDISYGFHGEYLPVAANDNQYVKIRFRVLGGAENDQAAFDNVSVTAEKIDCIPPTMDSIPQPEGECYSTSSPIISLKFLDDLGLDSAYYQVDNYNGQGWQGPIFGDESGTEWEDTAWQLNPMIFDGLADGSHTIYFYVYDDYYNKNGYSGELSWTFCKDTTPPIVNVNLGEPLIYLPGYLWPMIGQITPVYINASDDGCIGAQYIEYSLMGGIPGSYITVEDGKAGDVDDRYGYVSVLLYFNEDCHHEINYRAMDYCDNWNPTQTGSIPEDFYVDATPPDTQVEIEGIELECQEPGTEYTWLGSCATKWINSTDDGCQGGAGVEILKIVVTYDDPNVEGINYEIIENYEIHDQYLGMDFPPIGPGNYEDLDPDYGEISVAFKFQEDCMHEVMHWAVDYVGNNEVSVWDTNTNKQNHYVDLTPPITTLGEVSSCWKDCFEVCVNTTTPIKIFTNNAGVLPCVYEDYWTFLRIYVEAEDKWYPDNGDYAGFSSSTAQQWKNKLWFAFKNTSEVSFTFQEECNHTLEFFSKDPLCNTEETDTYYFHVDDQAPFINKTVGEPICYKPDQEGYVDVLCINTTTPIKIEAWDLGCCDMLSQVYYNIYEFVTGNRVLKETIDLSSFIVDGYLDKTITIPYECEHDLEIVAKDCLGNTATHLEKFFVDEKAPYIKKTVGEPSCQKPNQCGFEDVCCINTTTPIKIEAWDEGCCGNLTEVYYYIEDAQGMHGPFDAYTDILAYGYHEFTIPDECEHNLTIIAKDCLGNTATHKEKFYVDEQAPLIEKTVTGDQCQKPDEPGFEDVLCITSNTLIKINASDLGCCGVLKNVSYRIDGPGYDNSWINLLSLGLPYEFTIPYECEHVLEIVAEDCLGNTATHKEKFFVDNQAPFINKTVGDPNCTHNINNCFCLDSIEQAMDMWCVKTTTPITIDAWDLGCCDNLSNVSYRIFFNDVWSDWVDITDYIVNIGAYTFNPFTEECRHALEIVAKDCLGNTNYDTEIFYVDDTPPVIIKTIDNPNYINCNDCVSDLTNPGFETGDLSAWTATVTDSVTVLGPDSFTSPFTGDYMVRLGDDNNGGAQTIGPNEVYQEFVANQEVFMFAYNIFTYDYAGFNHFKYSLKTADGEVIAEFSQGAWGASGDISLKSTGWKVVAIDIPSKYIGETLNFTIGCAGTIDSLFSTWTYVDCAPNADYFVTTHTEITIDSYELGCCGLELENVSYRIGFDGTLGDWIDITDQLPYTFTFEEECIHTLEIVSKDCLGNTNNHFETFYVDDTPPETEKTFIGPTYHADEDDISEFNLLTDNEKDNFWLRDHDTWVVINATDDNQVCASGVKYLHVELWWDSDLDDVIDTFLWAIDVYDGDDNDSDDTAGKVQYKFQIDEDCLHEIRWYAVDNLGNGEPVVLFEDDFEDGLGKWDYEHTVTKDNYLSHDGYYAEVEAKELSFCPFHGYMYTSINTTGFDSISLSYWARTRQTNYNDWFKALWRDGDIGGDYNLIQKIRHDCYWKYYYHALDDAAGLDNMQLKYKMDCDHDYGLLDDVLVIGYPTMNIQKHRVDSQPPVIIKEVGEPSITEDEITWWVTMYTEICIDAYDVMEPCAVGLKTLEYSIEYPAGVWSEWKEYNGCFTFTEGCVHNLSIRATDYLGNVAYDNETFVVHGPSGSDDPNIEIIYPETRPASYPYSEKTLKVVINASDMETPWPELDVKLWIPGGRRDAPDLSYDVIPGDEENTYWSYVPIHCYQNRAQLTLWALAIDEDGNTEFAVPVNFFVDSTILWDQWMQYGWNPLPLSGSGLPEAIDCNNSIERILSSIDGSYDLVAHYDPDNPEGPWISYLVGAEDNELTTIESGKSYWVHITNETGLRFFIGLPEVAIRNPEEGSTFAYLDTIEVDGLAWNSEVGIESVDIELYYKNETNVKHYWNGTDWTTIKTSLSCYLDGVETYVQYWAYDSSGVNWIADEEYTIHAIATDGFGCIAHDWVNFEVIIEE